MPNARMFYAAYRSDHALSVVECGIGCLTCTSDAADKVTCTKCSTKTGYYLKAGACVGMY